MSEPLPVVSLARHGDTAWTHSGQHTGRKDLPLTEDGERHARQLGERLKSMKFTKVFTSPLQRAMRTCELAGFGPRPKLIPTSWSGTSVNTKACAWPRFWRTIRIGRFSAMGAREENRQPTSVSAQIVSCSAFVQSTLMCSFSRVEILFGSWLPGG